MVAEKLILYCTSDLNIASMRPCVPVQFYYVAGTWASHKPPGQSACNVLFLCTKYGCRYYLTFNFFLFYIVFIKLFKSINKKDIFSKFPTFFKEKSVNIL